MRVRLRVRTRTRQYFCTLRKKIPCRSFLCSDIANVPSVFHELKRSVFLAKSPALRDPAATFAHSRAV